MTSACSVRAGIGGKRLCPHGKPKYGTVSRPIPCRICAGLGPKCPHGWRCRRPQCYGKPLGSKTVCNGCGLRMMSCACNETVRTGQTWAKQEREYCLRLIEEHGAEAAFESDPIWHVLAKELNTGQMLQRRDQAAKFVETCVLCMCVRVCVWFCVCVIRSDGIGSFRLVPQRETFEEADGDRGAEAHSRTPSCSRQDRPETCKVTDPTSHHSETVVDQFSTARWGNKKQPETRRCFAGRMVLFEEAEG